MRGDTEGSIRVDKITDVAGRVLEGDEADPVQGVVSVVHLRGPYLSPYLPATDSEAGSSWPVARNCSRSRSGKWARLRKCWMRAEGGLNPAAAQRAVTLM
jgi:hypothetical protein